LNTILSSASSLAIETRWRALRRGALAGVTPGTAAWIRDDSSLTRRVMAACNGVFSVRVIRQLPGLPLPSERRLLRMARGERALVREVELLCGDVPWVFARTLIPFGSLRGRARRLAHLGNRPLGAVLFADPTTERRCVEVARLGARHPLFARAVRNLDHRPLDLWGRRTLFLYADRPLLVNEIFLPGIPLVESK
jgi:chorismate--pyruvate lyase